MSKAATTAQVDMTPEGRKVMDAAFKRAAPDDSKMDGGRITAGQVAMMAHDVADSMARSAHGFAQALTDVAEDRGGATKSDLEAMATFAELAGKQEKERKALVESVRMFRMTMTSEVAQVEKAVTTLTRLGIKDLCADMERLAKVVESPAMQALIRGLGGAK